MRELDERRIGLLARMLGFRSVICSKRTGEPLVARGFAKNTDSGKGYEITPTGRKYIEEYCRSLPKKGRQIETWRILGFGSIVGIVEDNRRTARKD